MKAWAERHPNITTWAVLAVGMVAVLAWSAQEVGLTTRQWFWLSLATVGVAGLCAWIISWEADAPLPEPAEADATPDDSGADATSDDSGLESTDTGSADAEGVGAAGL